MARATGLTQEQLRAIGDRCRNVSKGKFEDLEEFDVPVEFEPLKSNKVSLFPGNTSCSLYSLGELYLDFSVNTSPDNQEIYFFTNEKGPQKTTTWWNRDPVLTQQLSPNQRLVTITYNSCEWIVLANKIMVIGRPTYSGFGDRMLASSLISKNDRALILQTISEIPQNIRGKIVSDEGVSDGTHLSVRFSSDGKRSDGDIVASNAWTDEIGPLLDVISRLSPKDYPIFFREQIATMFQNQERPPATVRTLSDWDAMYNPRPKTPWWCVWRSLIK